MKTNQEYYTNKQGKIILTKGFYRDEYWLATGDLEVKGIKVYIWSFKIGEYFSQKWTKNSFLFPQRQFLRFNIKTYY